jgi:hypothetical protein
MIPGFEDAIPLTSIPDCPNAAEYPPPIEIAEKSANPSARE